MPRPVFIICHTLGSVDRETNLLSLFRIVEKMQFTPISVPPQTGGTLVIEKDPMYVVAAWMRNPTDDPSDSYEYEMSISLPGGKDIGLASGEFQFDEKRPLHRFIADMRIQLPVQQSGIMTIESRIRKKGDHGWIRQNYPIIVEMLEPAVVAPPVTPSV